jgi:hypothetical protein
MCVTFRILIIIILKLGWNSEGFGRRPSEETYNLLHLQYRKRRQTGNQQETRGK